MPIVVIPLLKKKSNLCVLRVIYYISQYIKVANGQ